MTPSMGHDSTVRVLPIPTATVSDDAVIRALSALAGIVNPVLDLLWDTDPLGVKTYPQPDGVDDLREAIARLLNAVEVPGTSAWAGLSDAERDQWWVRRVGAVNTVLVAFPGVLGAIADRLPIQDALGFVNQAVIIIAVAREHGVRDRDQQARLLAAVLCGRSTPDDTSAPQPQPRTPVTATGVATTAWHTLGVARAAIDEIGKRPQPARIFRLLGMLPAVGAVADYIGEYRALGRATDAGKHWLASAKHA